MSFEMVYNSKAAICRANGTEIWDLGTLTQYKWSTFDRVVFKIILMPFSALLLK